jgi:hypothetical protein
MIGEMAQRLREIQGKRKDERNTKYPAISGSENFGRLFRGNWPGCWQRVGHLNTSDTL